MTEDNREKEELEKAGLAPPRDVSSLSEEEIEALAEQAKSLHSKESTIVIKSVRNFDPVPLTPEEIRRRLEEEELELADARARREAKRRLDRKIRASRWDSKVPSKLSEATLDLLPTELRKVVNKWMDKDDSEKRTMIITGKVGVGKTTTLYAIARELYIDRFEVMLLNVSRLLDSIKPGADNSARTFEKYQKCHYLMLDDLGSERRSDWSIERLQMIFDYRWQNELPTVITTNVAPEGLWDLLGARSASRLLDGATVYKITGKNYRNDE